MKIRKFEAQWAGPFSSVDLDLENMSGIWTVTGNDADSPEEDYSNGVGKTSLYDLIGYAISGKSMEDRQLGELVHDSITKRKAKRKMETRVLVDNIEIKRGQKPKKFEVNRLDPDGSVFQELTTTASQDWLWNEWGINWDTFQFIMRFGGDENDLKSFAKTSAEKRRKIQDALIQADRITACLKEARSMKNESAKSFAVLDGRTSDARDWLVEAEEELAKAEAQIEESRKERQERVQLLKAKIAKWDNFDFDEAFEIAEAYEKKHTQLQKAKEELELVREKGVETKAEIAKRTKKIEDAEQSIKTLKRSLVDVESLEEELEHWTAKRAALNHEIERLMQESEKRTPLEKQLDEVNTAIGEKKQEIALLNESLEEVGELTPLEDVEVIEKSIRKLQEEIKEHQKTLDFNKRREDAMGARQKPQHFQGVLDDIEKSKSKIKSRINKIEREIEKTEELDEDSACPTCGQAVTTESKSSVIQKFEDLLEEEKQAFADMEVEEKSVRDDLLVAQEEMAEYKEAVALRKEAEEAIASARIKIEDERQLLDAVRQKSLQYETLVAKRDIAKEKISAVTTIFEGLKAQRLRIKSEIKELGEPVEGKREALDEIERSVTKSHKALKMAREENEESEIEIMKLTSSIRLFQEQIDEFESLLVEIDRLQDTMREKIEKLTKKLRGFCYEDGQPPESKEELDGILDDLKKMKETLEDLENNDQGKYLEQAKKSASDRVAKLNKMVEDLEKQANEQEKIIPYLDYWITAFGTEGIRTLAMKDLIPIINQEIDRFMEYLEGKRVRAYFDDEMNLIVKHWDTGEETSYRKISGGMKKRVNISIACAFREVIRASSGCDLSLFVVDESADALDTPGKLGFVNLLQDMAQDSTIWIITHDKVLREALDQVASGNIHVQMRGDVSEVSLEAF